MAKPDVGSWKKAKRIARYLRQVPSTVLGYDWQSDEADLEGYSDSDWAGCRVTGKSTSGGVVMIGEHYVKGWSRTQNCDTLSSGEAELVAMCKVTAETIGILNMAADWGEVRQARS